MRRFLFATAALLTVAASTSSAGYLIIRVLLEGSGGAAPGGSPPGGGLMSSSGGGGRGSGGTGSPDGGEGGPPGTSGGAPPGTSAGGPPGGPPRGMMPPPGMGSAGAASGRAGPSDPARSIVVVIPFTKTPNERTFYPKQPAHPMNNPKWDFSMVNAFGGNTNLFTDGSTVQWYMNAAQTPGVNTTRATQVTSRYTTWTRNKTADGLLELVSDALEHGMVPEASKYADELLALTKAGKTGGSPGLQRFTQAYAAIQEKLAAAPTKPNDAQRWRDTLDSADARFMTRGHYSLVYWDASNEEVGRRFQLLEDNFRAFYLWHALQGIVLDVPDRPLVAVLPRRASDLFPLSRGLDGLPIEADAFYSPEHDLLVLSPERADEAGQTFLRQNQQVIYKDGLSRAKLLLGEGPKIEGSNNKEHVARMMTLALVEKYAELESELAGVSREGCRQLLHASGAVPRHVVLPRWLSNGSANFFTRPKGPVFTKKLKPIPAQGTTPGSEYHMTVALTTGYGVPNYVMQTHFRDLEAAKLLNPDRGTLLRNVVSDAYFLALSKDGEDVDPLPKELTGPPVPKGGSVGGFTPPGGGIGGGLASGAGGPPPGMSMGSGGGPPPGMSMGGTPPRGSIGSGGGPPPGTSMGGSAAPTGPQFEDPIAAKRKKVERLSEKAQATSWALYYYLAKRHKDGLRAYMDELARLPRDLPIDDLTLMNVFAKSFNLTTGAVSEGGKKTFAEFAQEWMRFVTELPPVGIEVNLPDPPPATGTGGPGTPGMPNAPPPSFPGGSGGTG